MPKVTSPYAPKPLSVPDYLVDRYRAAGFRVESEKPAPAPAGEATEDEPAADADPVDETASKAPAASASRGQWAAYAQALGIEPGDLTKADLMEATRARTE